MTKRHALAAATLTLALLAGGPAGAGTPEQPEITDPAGDGNGINGQGVLLGAEAGPDSRPFSIDGADLRAIWFQTAYDVIKVRDASKNLLEVQYRPYAFRIHIKTEATAAPSFGPTLVYRVPADLSGCGVFFQMWIRGPASVPQNDPPQRADIRKLDSTCPGGAATLAPAGFSLSVQGQVATLEYSLSAAPTLIALGTPVAPDGNPHVRPLLGAATVPVIDETVQAAGPFVIGSDVPKNVDCRATPDEPACLS